MRHSNLFDRKNYFGVVVQQKFSICLHIQFIRFVILIQFETAIKQHQPHQALTKRKKKIVLCKFIE